MISKQSQRFIVLYFFLLTLHIVMEYTPGIWHYLTKPAILFSLLVFFIKNSSHLGKRTRSAMVCALLFSLLGDILLMFVKKSPLFFTGGLAAFLIAHILFIVVFLKKKSLKHPYYMFMALLGGYALGLFYLIKTNLGDMMAPVVLYIIVILAMALSAFLRRKNTTRLSYTLVLLGAVFFLISDSILALNKFYKPLFYPQVSIMLTYGLAQFFITLGILKQDH